MEAATVLELINTNFVDKGTYVGQNAERYLELLSDVGSSGIVGGRVYDALIARWADMAHVDALLTFNIRDFQGLTTHATVVAPVPG